MMRSQKFRRKSIPITPSRWTTYATAGIATALGCVATTEDAVASIHYSGPINAFFSGNSAYFQLDQPGNSVNPSHFGSAGFGSAIFFMNGINAESVAGFSINQYASKLGSGVNLTTHTAWVPRAGVLARFSGFTNSQWLQPGTGFVGFRFDGGSGLQYGWARITMDGAPGNTFTLVDFAYGDFGDQISTGQVPEPGSLALLALGAVGLLAWRERRCHA